MGDFLNSIVVLLNFIIIPGLSYGSQLALGALGVTFVYAILRFANFAHGEIIALGAISTLFLSSPVDSRVIFLDRFSPLGNNFYISVLASVILCGLFGGILEFFLFRPLRKAEVGNIAVLVVTIGLSLFLRHIYLLFNAKPQNFPLELQRRETYLFFDMTPRNFRVLILGIFVMVLIGLFLNYTRIGKAMRAVRDSNDLASVSGINSDNIILFTWISSSMLAGLAGVFQATINDVRYNMGFLILLLIFAGTVLGGIGTSFGAMVGGFIIGIVVNVSVGLPFMEGHTEAKNAVALAIMILILLFRPQGIFGEKERVSRKLPLKVL